MTNVLRGRLPYYAYDDIATLRQAVIKASSSKWPHPRIISYKNAKLLFRIVNNFNPRLIMQVGTCYGVSSASMLAVSSRSHIVLYEPELDKYPATREVMEMLGERVECHDALESTMDSYTHQLGSDKPFLLINQVNTKAEADALSQYVKSLLGGECVIVMRNLARSKRMKGLWQEWHGWAQHGQTFTNEKIAVIVASPKLQREDFFLWF